MTDSRYNVVHLTTPLLPLVDDRTGSTSRLVAHLGVLSMFRVKMVGMITAGDNGEWTLDDGLGSKVSCRVGKNDRPRVGSTLMSEGALYVGSLRLTHIVRLKVGDGAGALCGALCTVG